MLNDIVLFVYGNYYGKGIFIHITVHYYFIYSLLICLGSNGYLQYSSDHL